MNLPPLGIDLDGVVIDHAAQFIREARARGYLLTPRSAGTNLIDARIPPRVLRKMRMVVYAEQRGPERPYPGALRSLAALRESIFLASVQKDPGGERRLRRWLRANGLLRLLSRRRIFIFRSRRAKLAFLRRARPRAFMDDGLGVLRGLPRATAPILFDPHRSYPLLARHASPRPSPAFLRRMIVARSWPKATALLRRLLRSSEGRTFKGARSTKRAPRSR